MVRCGDRGQHSAMSLRSEGAKHPCPTAPTAPAATHTAGSARFGHQPAGADVDRGAGAGREAGNQPQAQVTGPQQLCASMADTGQTGAKDLPPNQCVRPSPHLHTVSMAAGWVANVRSSTTLVMLALASLVVAGCFLLAGALSVKPAAPVDPPGHGPIYVCPVTREPTTCGPQPDLVWPTAGAAVCAGFAAVLLAAAGWTLVRTKRRPLSDLG